MPFFSHNDVTLYYEVHGSGPPLVLLAGLASDSQSWLPLLPLLSEHYTVVVLDNRGVGRSTQECSISIPLMVDDTMALIRHLELKKVSLLGHSMGGMVALECALRYPEIVQCLMLAATTARNSNRNNLLFTDWAIAYAAGSNPAAWFRTVFAWIFTERFFDNQPLVDAAVQYLLAYPWPQSAGAFRRQTEAIATFDATALLASVAVPVLVLAGQQDILMPLSAAEQLAEHIPGARLVVVEHAAHSIHTEQPELFFAEIDRYLKDFHKEEP